MIPMKCSSLDDAPSGQTKDQDGKTTIMAGFIMEFENVRSMEDGGWRMEGASCQDLTRNDATLLVETSAETRG
jgi:hypothetical protein